LRRYDRIAVNTTFVGNSNVRACRLGIHQVTPRDSGLKSSPVPNPWESEPRLVSCACCLAGLGGQDTEQCIYKFILEVARHSWLTRRATQHGTHAYGRHGADSVWCCPLRLTRLLRTARACLARNTSLPVIPCLIKTAGMIFSAHDLPDTATTIAASHRHRCSNRIQWTFLRADSYEYILMI